MVRYPPICQLVLYYCYFKCKNVIASQLQVNIRSCHQMCSVKKCVLRNFIKFTGKHLFQSIFFIRVADLRAATLLKKRLTQVFSCGLCEISKNTFFTEHLLATASEMCMRQSNPFSLTHFSPVSHFYTP